MKDQIILKSIGGLYHVETADGVVISKARGIFRLQNISPMAGDRVLLGEENGEYIITDILERKNEIIRPPLANLDIVIIVVSTVEPVPNAYVIDKLIAIFESKKIETVIAFTKTDKKIKKNFIEIYDNAGYKTFLIDNTNASGVDSLTEYISGKTSALIGNSGVGKSSLINHLIPELDIKTAGISKKLGRGKHTTRQVELYPKNGGYIADTPGFSTVEASRYGDFLPSEIADYFVEFSRVKKCPFSDCTHTGEGECEIKKAVASGIIAKSRYESYLRLYEDVENSNKW